MKIGVRERLEREYRERRRVEDERRREERRREIEETRDWRGALEKNPYAGWTTEELLVDAGRRWGVDFFEGAQPRAVPHKPSGVEVEVIEAPERERRRDSVAMAALRIIFGEKS